ncbi:MAG: conjugal transfer protein TraI [Blastomonas sp. CACIA14H2]|uniref:TrbI/VirB10 family protein n=1 Tax=Blastomonas sp. CACIA14H2 TaxID=1419876 RepID=UPI0003D025DC|nr:MAG: conjugal transfer protein TraI [Blastomonas sp. CACIA14H2]
MTSRPEDQALGPGADKSGTQNAPVDEQPPVPTGSNRFRFRAELPKVTRLSRKAVATIGLAGSIAIGGSLIYALRPEDPAPARNLYDRGDGNRTEQLADAPASYADLGNRGLPPVDELRQAATLGADTGSEVPLPPVEPPLSGASTPDPSAAAAEQARARAAQERDSARTSQLFLAGNTGVRNNVAAPAAAAGGTTAGAAADPVQSAPPSQAERRRGFLEQRKVREASPVVRDAGQGILQAGSIIPAALITGIRSDLPGQITAQVTQNVYDSPTGRILLIPQGSRLIGEYDSDVAAGQSRVLLAWDRLILPGGQSVSLERLPGADAAGMAGLEDRTDYHWGNMLKSALVSTLLGVGSEFVTGNDSDLAGALRFGSQDTINQTGRQVVQRQLNVPPTLTVRPGSSFRIIVTRDLILEPFDAGAGR